MVCNRPESQYDRNVHSPTAGRSGSYPVVKRKVPGTGRAIGNKASAGGEAYDRRRCLDKRGQISRIWILLCRFSGCISNDDAL